VVLSLSAVTWPGLFFGWLAWGQLGGARMLLSLSITMVLSTLAFNAFFAIFAVLLPRRAMVVGFIVALIVEVVLTLIPTVISLFTLGYYLRSASFEMAGMKLQEAQAIINGAKLNRSLGEFTERFTGFGSGGMSRNDIRWWEWVLDYLSRLQGDVSLTSSITTLLVATFVAIAFAAWSAGRREYVINEQA
jgi:hypothetical protein